MVQRITRVPCPAAERIGAFRARVPARGWIGPGLLPASVPIDRSGAR
jgi:hypothetical protein